MWLVCNINFKNLIKKHKQLLDKQRVDINEKFKFFREDTKMLILGSDSMKRLKSHTR